MPVHPNRIHAVYRVSTQIADMYSYVNEIRVYAALVTNEKFTFCAESSAASLDNAVQPSAPRTCPVYVLIIQIGVWGAHVTVRTDFVKSWSSCL